jgi:hypothetical protein
VRKVILLAVAAAVATMPAVYGLIGNTSFSSTVTPIVPAGAVIASYANDDSAQHEVAEHSSTARPTSHDSDDQSGYDDSDDSSRSTPSGSATGTTGSARHYEDSSDDAYERSAKSGSGTSKASHYEDDSDDAYEHSAKSTASKTGSVSPGATSSTS